MLGSGILLLIQTLLGIYKDMRRGKGNVFLLGKNMHGRHTAPAPERSFFPSSFHYFFWGGADLNLSGRPKKLNTMANSLCLQLNYASR